jgi:3-oxoacyl-[acyl-carrier-protein] synthase-3
VKQNMTRTAYITDIAGFLPNAPVGNDDIENVLGMINGRPSRSRKIVLRNNGIQTRHYAIDPVTGRFTHTNAQLAAEAVRALWKRSGLRSENMEVLSCGTSGPDQIKPGHAQMVHGELRSPPCEVVSLAGVCTAGAAAMKYAWMNITTGQALRAVATGSEMASSFMRARNFEPEIESRLQDLEQRPELAFEKDFLRWMLSDGAGAVLISSEPNSERLSLRIDWIDSLSYAGEMPVCMWSGAIKRPDGSLQGWQVPDDAQEILRESYFAVKQDARLLNEHVLPITVERSLPVVAARHGLSAGDITWFLPHYSSEYFRPRVSAALQHCNFGIPEERWFSNLTRKGNVGSAAIYLIMEEMFYSGRLKAGDRLLCYVPESARFAVTWFHLTVV